MFSVEPKHGSAEVTGGMSRREACALLAGLCGAAACRTAVAQQADNAPHTAVAVTLRDIRLEKLLSDRAELTATLEVTPAAAATLGEIRFGGLLLDGDTPVYTDPISGRFPLQAGKHFTLPTARITAYYSDFPSPTTMDAMLQAHHVRVTGDIRADLQLSLLGRLAVRERNPVAALSLNQDVPIDDDAVDAPIQLGIAALSLVQKALGASASLAQRIAGVRVVAAPDAAVLRSRDGMLLVQTTYRLTGKANPVERTCVRLGFLIDETHMLVPAEALEPWLYSLDTAAALGSGLLKLDGAAVETTLLPWNSDRVTKASSLKNGDFAITYRGHPPVSRLLLADGSSVSVLERESTQNFALLQPTQPFGRALPAWSAVPTAGRLDLLRRLADNRGGWDLEALPLGSASYNEPTRLPRPVDEKAFGSPLLAENRVAGMVVGERTVVPLREIQPLLHNPPLPLPAPGKARGNAASTAALAALVSRT